MDQLQIAPDYIRDERDFLTPLTAAQRFRRILTPQAALAPMAYPTTWVPAIDISAAGQTKAIAAAFPQLFAAGWKLIIMRASIGLTPDALFDYFWRAAKDAGLYMMTYHFGYTAYAGTSQASLYLKTIDQMLTAVDGHSAAVLDVESLGDITAWRKVVLDFHSGVKTKLTTGDYSSVSKWQSCTGNMMVPGFAWNASWSNLVDVPSFAPAIQTLLRQIGVSLKHPWVPKPPGVNEDVDVDYFMGTEEQLRKFLGYTETPPPPPPPPPPSDLEVKVDTLIGRVNTLTDKVDTMLATNRAEHLQMQADITNLVARVDAIVEGGIPTTKPRFQIGGSLANCRVIVGVNATNKPVMGIPPVGTHRIQFPAGTIVLLASNEKVDADGSVDYYRVDPSQYPEGEQAQYLRTTDGVLL